MRRARPPLARSANTVLVVLVLVGIALVALVGHARAEMAAESAGDPVRELLERHAPLLRVVDQPVACGPGEPYRAMRVDGVFDRDGVVLVGPGPQVVRPGEADLPSGPAADWYLDLPGNALRPGCSYEQLFDAWRTEPTIYGRIATEADRPDELVVQYWFYYLYNDWNDRHEGDWEMIQLVFPVGSAAEALEVEPTLAMYAQHYGAEVSDWRDDVLETVDGTRPVVYVAAGSHASYFSSARWFGKSSDSGFGCDDTQGPLVDVDPTVVVLDDEMLPKWASYTGHWGERQPSFNNGPLGPATNDKWAEPLTWMDANGRRGAANLPAGGTAVTDTFCSAARAGSVVLFGLLDRPWTVVGILLGLVVVAALLLRRTRWRPVVVAPLLARRDVGQMAASATTLVRRHPRVFVPIGLLLVVGGLIATALQALVLASTEIGDLADVAGRSSAWGALVGLAVGTLTAVPGAAAVTVLSMLAARRVADGRPGHLRVLLADLRTGWRAVVLAALLPGLGALLVLSVVGVPVALVLLLRWSVAVPAAIEHRSPLRRSSELTRGHRLRAVAVTVTALFFSAVVPATVGIVALLVSDLSFTLVNLIASLVAAVTVPVAAVTQLMQWADLETRSGHLTATRSTTNTSVSPPLIGPTPRLP